MIHESSGVKAVDVSVWHDTPWLFVSPYEGEDETFLRLLEADAPPGSTRIWGKVSVLTPQEMAAHRLRGHVPFEPSCETCQSCKGVHRHARKRTNKGLSVVIQADFGFFNRDSELVTDLEDDGRLLKFFGFERNIFFQSWCCFDVKRQTERSASVDQVVGRIWTEDE